MKHLACIFPGQGSQAVGMGEVFFQDPQARILFDKVSDRLGFDMQTLLLEGHLKSQQNALEQTQFAQPAILTLSSVAYALLRTDLAEDPKFFAGHSLGEFSALVAAGALSIEDAAFIVHKRGEWMHDAFAKGANQEAGMMVVLGLEDKVLELHVKSLQDQGLQIWCANYNTTGQMVLAGIKTDLNNALEGIKELGAKRAMLLNMSVASHCPLLDVVGEPLVELLDVYLKDEFLPVVSNVTAKPYRTKQEAVGLLKQQLVSPVLYKQSIQALEPQVELFVECGHGSVLKGLNKKLTGLPTLNADSLESIDAIVQEVS